MLPVKYVPFRIFLCHQNKFAIMLKERIWLTSFPTSWTEQSVLFSASPVAKRYIFDHIASLALVLSVKDQSGCSFLPVNFSLDPT